MKKIKFLSMLLITIIFYNCENYENNVINTPTSVVKNDLTAALNNQKIINNPFDTSSYIKNPEDLDDEKIQKQLLTLGLLSRDLFKDAHLNSIILSKAKKNQSEAIRFSDFLSEISPNEENYTEISNFIRNIDLTHRSQNPYNRGTTEAYNPAIFVPNILIADPTRQPIITSGIEVNSELPELAMYENYIVSWYYDNGNWVEFLMSEEMSKNTSTPIFVVDNADPNTLNQMIALDDGGGGWSGLGGNGGTGGNSGNSGNGYTLPEFYINKYKINHRYESWGRSELYIVGRNIGQTLNYGLYSWGTGPFYNERLIARVRKSWIGNWRNDHELHSNGAINDYTFWNTFERDWYRSYKDLGSATRFGQTITLRGRRAYTNQWYAYPPSEINNNPLNKVMNSKYYTNSKGGYLIEK